MKDALHRVSVSGKRAREIAVKVSAVIDAEPLSDVPAIILALLMNLARCALINNTAEAAASVADDWSATLKRLISDSWVNKHRRTN